MGLVAALLRHFFAGNDEPNFFRGEEVKSAVSLKDPGYQIVDPYNASTDEQIKW